jgi:hypothetical protein
MKWSDLKSVSNILATIFFIVSCILGFLFFRFALDRREVSYQVDATSKVFDSNKYPIRAGVDWKDVKSNWLNSTNSWKDLGFGPITVFDSEGAQVAGDIFVTSITIWNSGTLDIEPDKVQLPVTVCLRPCDKILEAVIVKQSRPDICRFKLTNIGEPIEGGGKSLQLDWLHFDPDKGLRIQILYTGSKDATPSLDGYLALMKPFKKSTEKRQDRSALFWQLFNIVCLIACLLMTRSMKDIFREVPFFRWLRLGMIVVLVLSTLTLAIMAMMYLTSKQVSFPQRIMESGGASGKY